MSIKVALLKSGESVIADIKELISDEKVCGYLFKNPYSINLVPKYGFLREEVTPQEDENDLNVSFSPWIPITSDEQIPVRHDWLVTVVNPIEEILKLYEDMINGENDQTDSTDEQ